MADTDPHPDFPGYTVEEVRRTEEMLPEGWRIDSQDGYLYGPDGPATVSETLEMLRTVMGKVGDDGTLDPIRINPAGVMLKGLTDYIHTLIMMQVDAGPDSFCSDLIRFILEDLALVGHILYLAEPNSDKADLLEYARKTPQDPTVGVAFKRWEGFQEKYPHYFEGVRS